MMEKNHQSWIINDPKLSPLSKKDYKSIFEKDNKDGKFKYNIETLKRHH